MFNFLKPAAKRCSKIQSPTIVQGKSLNKGENHDAVDLAQEIAYRFGWMKSPDGGIYDAKCKHKIATDLNNLLYKMDAKEWIHGSGPASRIEWDLVKLQESESAAARLLS